MKKILVTLTLFLAVQLLNAQTFNWQNTIRHVNVGLGTTCTAVAIDSKGNTVMLYDISSDNLARYIAINKYNKQGVLIGSISHARIETNFYDAGKRLLIDSADDIYVQSTEDNYNNSGNRASSIIKYNKNLNFLWQHVVYDGGIPYYYSYPLDMKTDAQFNLYLLSRECDTTSNWKEHFKIQKYSKDGVLLFDLNIAHLTCGLTINRFNAMAVDTSGNMYLHGSAQDQNGIYCAVTAKYSPSGAKVWYRKFIVPYSSSVGGGNYASHCTVDAQGNVIVAGYYGFPSPNYFTNSYLIKYAPSGARLFKKDDIINSINAYTDALQTDTASNIYHVIRIGYGGNAHYSFMIMKYNATGKLVASCPLIYDELTDFKVSEGGSVFALGGFHNSYSGIGIESPTLVKFSSQLKFEWIYTYYTSLTNQNELSDIPKCLAINRDNGEVAAAGEYYSSFTDGNPDEYGLTTLNLKNENMARPVNNGADEFCDDKLADKNALTTSLILSPNPTTDFITVTKNDIEHIEIYNSNGQQVKAIAANKQSNTNCDVSSLPAGVYMVDVTAADGKSSATFVKK